MIEVHRESLVKGYEAEYSSGFSHAFGLGGIWLREPVPGASPHAIVRKAQSPNLGKTAGGINL